MITTHTQQSRLRSLSLKGRLEVAFLFCLSLAMLSCGPEGSSFRIKGTFRDMQAGELYIYNLSDDNPRFDTLKVADGRFTYKGEVRETTPFMLVFPNGIEQVIFVGQGQDIKYEATANDLKNYVVNGNDENKLMNKFRQETYTQNPSMVVSTARQYISDNASPLVAEYLFNHYFLNNPDVSTAEIKAVLNVLKSKQPDNNHYKNIDHRISAAERCGVGKTLPDITLTRLGKDTKKLWESQKEYNLIAFWAIWMPGGYDMSWRIRQLCDTHKDSGRLRVAAVSLDIERHRWEEIARGDSLSAVEHYCDGLGFESPVAKQYGITALPLFILTDRSHKVIESTTSYDEIKSAIEKMLK